MLSSVFKLRSEEILGFCSNSENQLRNNKESVPFNKTKAISDSESALLVKVLKDFFVAADSFVNDLHSVKFN